MSLQKKIFLTKNLVNIKSKYNSIKTLLLYKSGRKVVLKRIYFILLIIFLIIGVSIATLNIFNSIRLNQYIKNTYEIDSLQPRNTALILGAGLNADTSPSSMLKDRLDIGYILLQKHLVKNLILSGDNRQENYNEPEAMKNYLIKRGVPAKQLIEDFAGRRTYDSCYRAKQIFGQDKMYVVTQNFHILRSVFLCRSLGIDTIGITADLHNYPDVFLNQLRDNLGLVEAFWDIKITHPLPILGPQIQI